jgi:hypothetical protein
MKYIIKEYNNMKYKIKIKLPTYLLIFNNYLYHRFY